MLTNEDILKSEELLIIINNHNISSWDLAVNIVKFLKRRVCIDCGSRNIKFYKRKRIRKSKIEVQEGNVCILCHRDKIKEADAKYYRLNKKKCYLRTKEWKKKNRYKINMADRRRYLKRKEVTLNAYKCEYNQL